MIWVISYTTDHFSGLCIENHSTESLALPIKDNEDMGITNFKYASTTAAVESGFSFLGPG